MLSRRGFLAAGGGAAAAGLATVPGRAASHATPLAAATPVDLTHELSEDFPTFGGEPGFSAEKVFDIEKDGYNLLQLTINEHTGTHIDAPLHFSADGASVAELPVGDLVVPLVVIDIAARAAEDPDAEVLPEDIQDWIAEHGEMPDNCCVAMHSGWSGKVGTDGFRNADADGTMHFPGFHPKATQFLIEETPAKGMAVDTLSLDHGPSKGFETHYAWLPSGRWGLECMALPDDLPPVGATLMVGAPKHRGGTGGPARVIALVPA